MSNHNPLRWRLINSQQLEKLQPPVDSRHIQSSKTLTTSLSHSSVIRKTRLFFVHITHHWAHSVIKCLQARTIKFKTPETKWKYLLQGNQTSTQLGERRESRCSWTKCSHELNHPTSTQKVIARKAVGHEQSLHRSWTPTICLTTMGNLLRKRR